MFVFKCIFEVWGEHRSRIRRIANESALRGRWRDNRDSFRRQSSIEFTDNDDLKRFLGRIYLCECDLVVALVKPP